MFAAVFAVRIGKYAGLAVLLGAFVLLGCLLYLRERASIFNAPLAGIIERDSPSEFGGRVAGFPRLGGTYARILVSVDRVGKTRYARSIGKMMLFWKAEGERDINWGDRISFIASASAPEPAKNPGEFDWREYLYSRGACSQGFAMGDSWVNRRGQPSTLAKAYAAARAKLFTALTRGQEPPGREILISIIYGDKTTELDPDVEEEFRRAGLTHILVVSGTQVSLIIFFLIGLLSPREDDLTMRGALARVAAGAAVIGAVFFYSVITGFETSVVRALMMGVLFLIARLFTRESDGLSELARASIIILAFQPGQLFGASFQLSFAACAGLIYVYGILGPRIIGNMRGIKSYLLLTLITTGGAQIFVAPVLAAHFNQFSAWGLPANLIAIPLAALILMLGIVYNIAGVLGIAVFSGVQAYVLSKLLLLLMGTAKVFAGLPGSNIVVATPSPLSLTLTYGAILLTGEIARRLWRPRGAEPALAGSDLVPGAGGHAAISASPETARRALTLRIAFTVLSAMLLALLFLSAFVHRSRPRLVVLSAKTGGALLLEDGRGGFAALLAPAGSDSMRKNTARLLASALKHYGVDRTSAIFLLGEPGELAEKELAQVQSAKTYSDDNYEIWSGRGAAIGVNAGRDSASHEITPESSLYVSIGVHGKEIIYIPFDAKTSELKELLSRGKPPDVIIAQNAVIEKAERILAAKGAEGAGPSAVYVATDGGGTGINGAPGLADGAVSI